jgi:surface protein
MGRMFANGMSLTSVTFGDNFDTSNVTNMSTMFYSCENLKSLNVSSFDTSKVTNMYSMFSYCKGLTSLDLSNFDTSKVTSMEEMFRNCNKLTELDLSNFDTSNVTNMKNMFKYCTSLTSLNVSSFNTSKVTNMYGMFSDCTSLKSLDLSSFDTSKVTSMDYMFSFSNNLTDLIWNNLGNGSGYTAISLSNLSKLGINTEAYPNARQHLTDSLITYSYDRATNGYSTCTITLHANTKAVLTNEEIAQITAKGFTIA